MPNTPASPKPASQPSSCLQQGEERFRSDVREIEQVFEVTRLEARRRTAEQIVIFDDDGRTKASPVAVDSGRPPTVACTGSVASSVPVGVQIGERVAARAGELADSDAPIAVGIVQRPFDAAIERHAAGDDLSAKETSL